MSDISLISELIALHLCLYTAPPFDGIITRESSSITGTSVKVKNKGKRENQGQKLTKSSHTLALNIQVRNAGNMQAFIVF